MDYNHLHQADIVMLHETRVMLQVKEIENDEFIGEVAQVEGYKKISEIQDLKVKFESKRSLRAFVKYKKGEADKEREIIHHGDFTVWLSEVHILSEEEKREQEESLRKIREYYAIQSGKEASDQGENPLPYWMKDETCAPSVNIEN